MKTMESNNKVAHTGNESAAERIRMDFEKLRTDIEKAFEELRTTTEKNSRILLLEIAVVVGLGVVVMSLIAGLIVS
ncbi:MAG: hypothetical protein OXF05_08715 [Hyphomicrobiales bacterium]|nr:hypothetical protein [Hyphomicrobiales bacterium]MCY4032540.1 hypothetical protein [Hyphomicrobiales bacterium]